VRERYYLLVSILYIALGIIILVRSVTSHVAPVGILGLVFIVLGAVRLRDYAGRSGTP
jgi:uncharacterized membrane protein HdeD (DUF308 family)